MKKLSFIFVGISLIVCFIFLFHTKEVVHVKHSIDDCLELEKKLAVEGGSKEEWQRVKDCQAEQASRLGLDAPLPEDAFLGDEVNAPEGSFAYFHGFGQNDSITVFSDKIEFRSQLGYPSGLQNIPFTQITEIVLEHSPVPTILITYEGEQGMVYELSISLYTRGNPLMPNADKHTQALYELLTEFHADSQ